MAASDARPIPRKNVAYRVTFPILDADGDLVSGATALDSEVSLDGAGFSDCTSEATEIATASGVYYLDLTADEMNGDTVAVIVKTTSSGAKTTVLVFYPEELGDVRVNIGQWNGTAVPSEHTAGYPIVTLKDGTGTGEVDTASGKVSIATGGIVAASFGAGAIDAAAIATGAIDADAIADNAIDAAAIATGAITAAKFAAGAIDAAAIATNAIDADAIAADAVTEIQAGLATSASIAALNDLSAAEVNAEVVDALATDTYTEPGSVPAATATLAAKIGWLAMLARNRVTQTASTQKLYADDGTTEEASAAVSDNGTTFERSEWTTT